MKKIIAQVKDPLVFKLSSHGYTILGSDKDGIHDLPLERGATLGGEHYGFTIIADTITDQSEITYPTQMRVAAAEFKDGELRVYEEHKYPLTWKFDKEGKLLQVAKFFAGRRDTMSFLSDYGVQTEADVEEINKDAYAREIKKGR